MRAVAVHALHDRSAVRLTEMPAPRAGRGEIAVQVAAASVNFPDLLMLEGKYQYRPEPPFVLGKDAAGRVIEIGDGVDGWAVGDRAMFYCHAGAFAEVAAVPVANAFKVPDGVSLEDAAAMGLVYPTAWMALVVRGGFAAGETVLVTGAAGGVGLAVVNLARALGAARVLAAVSGPAKAEAALAAGADAAIDTASLDDKDSIRRQVQAATDGQGADVCIDVVGGNVFDGAVRALAWGGRIVVVGFTEGRIPQLATNYLILKNIAAVGSPVAQYYDRQPALMHRIQDTLYQLARGGRIKPHVTRTFPMERFADALAVMEGREAIGKVLLRIG